MTAAPEINAIETSYAGCRFRSRLEARWAVFFDTLGISWEYEAQGYRIGSNQKPYLPDFWLPEMKLWAEVKGRLGYDDLQLLVAASGADGLPHNATGRPFSATTAPCRRRLMLLGAIPDPKPGWTPTHTLLYLIGPEVVGFHAFFVRPQAWDVLPFSEPSSVGYMSAGPDDAVMDDYRRGLLSPVAIPLVGPVPGLHEALWAARSARFEHGERP